MARIHARTMAIGNACTMAIVHECTMATVYASTVHACTIAIVQACATAIVNACTMAIVHVYPVAMVYVSCPAGLIFPRVETGRRARTDRGVGGRSPHPYCASQGFNRKSMQLDKAEHHGQGFKRWERQCCSDVVFNVLEEKLQLSLVSLSSLNP